MMFVDNIKYKVCYNERPKYFTMFFVLSNIATDKMVKYLSLLL